MFFFDVKLIGDPEKFDEKEFKKLLASRPENNTSHKHPKLSKLEKLIENFQNGLEISLKNNFIV